MRRLEAARRASTSGTSSKRHADAYEVDAYERVLAPLASDLEAWVYMDARDKPGTT